MLTMYQQITIKTLKKQGKTQQEIAQTLSCHRNTVANVIAREPCAEKQTRNKPSCFSAHHERIGSWLKTGISRVRIWEMLRDDYGIHHPYITLCKYVEKRFGKKTTAYVVQQTGAGEEAEVDFGYLGMLPDPDGTQKKTWVFVMTMSYSRDTFYCLVHDQTVATFIRCHQQALAYFSGIPKRIKYDNLKAVVIKNSRYDLEVNREFLLFSHHCGFVIVPCTPHQPQQKGKVEKGVEYVKGNFLPGRMFINWTDLVRQMNRWMHTIANVRIHGTTKKIPHVVFVAEEKQHLLPLPSHPFTYTPTLSRLVKPNCHVDVERTYYSVPFSLVGKTVEVRLWGELVRIFFQDQEVAVHAKSHTAGIFVTNESHYPGYKVYSETTYQKKYEDKMREVGPVAHAFFCRILRDDPKGWMKTVRLILGTARDFGSERTQRAIKRAAFYGATSGAVIRRICQKGLEDAPREPSLLTALRQETGTDERSATTDHSLSVPLSCDSSDHPGSIHDPVAPKTGSDRERMILSPEENTRLSVCIRP